jgi:hypothetical protein
MKYAIEMGSGVLIHIPSFMKIGSDIEELVAGRFTESQRTWR